MQFRCPTRGLELLPTEPSQRNFHQKIWCWKSHFVKVFVFEKIPSKIRCFSKTYIEKKPGAESRLKQVRFMLEIGIKTKKNYLFNIAMDVRYNQASCNQLVINDLNKRIWLYKVYSRKNNLFRKIIALDLHLFIKSKFCLSASNKENRCGDRNLAFSFN